MSISFEGRVAIVTGAGNGIGRAYAIELARRGAKVVVNDLGGTRGGTGHSDAALEVVEEIEAAGGEAISNGASVTEFDQMQAMVAQAKDKWGGVHILINNAGVLRDKSFAKMEMADFDFVLKVHLQGSAYATTKTLALEGAKYNVKVNTIVPVAATRMTEDILPEQVFETFAPENVVPAALYLVSEEAPTNAMVGAGAGGFHSAWVGMNEPLWLPEDERTVEDFAKHWDRISARESLLFPQSGAEQSALILKAAQQVKGGT